MKAKSVTMLAATAATMTLIASGIARSLFATSYIPHLYCYLAQPWLIWSNVATDSLIALSYVAIFAALFWLASRLRSLPNMHAYVWVLASFGLFILACGATHVMETVTIWVPVYRISVALKVVCALASVTTAIIFVKQAPIYLANITRFFTLIETEHRQTEALRKSEALLDRTNRIAGIGGWELDLTTNQVNWSAETARLHGMPPTFRPTVKEGIDFFAPEYRDAVVESLEKGLVSGDPWDLELQILRADGRRIWVRVLGEVEFLNGKPIRLFGSMQDKTQEIEQRLALRKSEALLDRTNRIAGIGGWDLDLVTKEMTWSAETARIHGLEPGHKPNLDEAIQFFGRKYHAVIRAALEKALSGGGGWDLELPLYRADGRKIWVRLLAEPEPLDGIPVRLFGSIQDKTEDFEQREAIRKSQSFLDRTNSIAGVGGWEVDIPTGVVTWSAETFRIHALPTTYKPTVEAGLSFYAESARPIIADAVERAFETRQGWDLELELIRADDKRIWVRTVGNVETIDGKPQRLIGAIQDTTARVNARLALQGANERAALATDSGGIAIWDWDIATNEFICDDWMFRIYGLEPTDAPTHMSLWADQIHPEDRRLVISALMDAIEDRKPYDMEFRIVRANGTTHIIKATGQVIRDQEGRARRMIGTNRDVTEAHRLTAELAQQHELLRVTLLSIGDAVVSKDVDRNIVWMNGAAERMTGWTAAEAIGRPVSDVFHVLYDASRIHAEMHVDPHTVAIRRIGMDEHILLISRDGTERNIESCATPIYDARADFIGSVLVVRDVTEQFRLARETEQINKLQLDLKLKDQFLSHVSHELRSPLTSVYSFTSIIADNLAGDTTVEQQEYLQIVLKNVLQLQAMIEDLLTVTQSKEGKIPIEAQNFAVAAAIRDAVHTSHPAAAARHISVDDQGVSEEHCAWTDPTRLRQIMIILLDNAIKFTPPGGHVFIRTFDEGKMLRIEVEDNGCGIPLDKRARVFEKLYQILGPGHADTSQEGRVGLGLGLHIARDLVRRQGGNIWVTGAPDQGSIFNFTLPTASEMADAGTTPRRRKTDWPTSVDSQLNPAA